MPDMTRTWVIPASDCLPEIKIDLREPTLTGDNLGLKTWGTAYALALILEQIGTEYLSQLLSKRDTYATATGEEVLVPCTEGACYCVPSMLRAIEEDADILRSLGVRLWYWSSWHSCGGCLGLGCYTHGS
jgi:hypothetical protein